MIVGSRKADIDVIDRPKVVINLAKKDRSHLEKWHKSINSCIKVCDKKDDTAQSQHYSKKMCQDLMKLGCMPRKSLKLEFPNIDKQFLNHFVRGYFDGDGCMELRKKSKQLRVSFIGTEAFLTELQAIFKTNNKLQPTINYNQQALIS